MSESWPCRGGCELTQKRDKGEMAVMRQTDPLQEMAYVITSGRLAAQWALGR